MLHLCKLNSRHHLWYASIPSFYAINSLLDTQHAKEQPPHRIVTSKLTAKQQTNLKSSIKDVNECLNSVRNCFNPLHSIFSPSSRVVNHFPNRISFYSSSSSDKNLYQHLQNLDHTFKASQILSNNIAIIADESIKKSYVITAVAHIWSDFSVIQCLQVHSINMSSIEAELMAIQTGLIPTMSWLGKMAKSLFIFLFFYLGLTTQKEVWKSVMSQVSHSHSVTSHDVT